MPLGRLVELAGTIEPLGRRSWRMEHRLAEAEPRRRAGQADRAMMRDLADTTELCLDPAAAAQVARDGGPAGQLMAD